MDIQVIWSWEMPEYIHGDIVVIDADAATTNIARFVSEGAKKLLLVDKDNIDAARKKYPDAMVIGEGKDFPQGFFDAGNEIYAAHEADVRQKIVLFMSNNGTRVIKSAYDHHASNVYAGSFANITPLVHFLQSQEPHLLYVCASGEKNFEDQKAVEDMVCAELIRDLIQGKTGNHVERILEAKEFIRTNYNHKHMNEDIELVFQFNAYDVIPVTRLLPDGLIEIYDAGTVRTGWSEQVQI